MLSHKVQSLEVKLETAYAGRQEHNLQLTSDFRFESCRSLHMATENLLLQFNSKLQFVYQFMILDSEQCHRKA